MDASNEYESKAKLEVGVKFCIQRQRTNFEKLANVQPKSMNQHKTIFLFCFPNHHCYKIAGTWPFGTEHLSPSAQALP